MDCRQEGWAWGKNGRRTAGIRANRQGPNKGAGWQGWGHWLGTGTTSTRAMKCLPFEEALAVARSSGQRLLKRQELHCAG